MTAKLLLQQVPPRRGLQWMRESFALFSRKPLALSVVLMVFLLGTLVAMLLPFIGPLLILAAFPLLSLAYMQATQDTLADQVVSPAVLWQPLTRSKPVERSRLITMGLLFATLTAALMALANVADGGAFGTLQQLAAQPRTEATAQQMSELLAQPGLLTGLAVRLGGTALLSIPFWHAPALVAWHGQGLGQALFSSTVALWRNRGAYTLCALGFLGVVLTFSLATGLVFGILGLQSMGVAAALPAGLIFTTVFYVSLYFGYRDTFSTVPSTDPGPTLTA
jgi:hypothetical protein